MLLSVLKAWQTCSVHFPPFATLIFISHFEICIFYIRVFKASPPPVNQWNSETTGRALCHIPPCAHAHASIGLKATCVSVRTSLNLTAGKLMGAAWSWQTAVSVCSPVLLPLLLHTKMAELAPLQVYPPLRPWLPWLLTMVTICNMAADFGRWMVHLSREVPGSVAQRGAFVTDSPPLCRCLHKRRAKAASAGRGMTQLQHRSCQSKLQGSRTKGGSHVACNFLEAIKPTLFNSISNTHAVLSVKWSFNAQLPIHSWKTGMWKALCKTMLNTSANFSGWRGM